MSTKVRDIAKILGRTETNNTTNIALRLSTEDVGLEVYETLDDLPTTDLTTGDTAFVPPTNRLYVSNGSGWYNVALSNATPRWVTEPNASYDITDSATPLVITAKAADSDNSDVNLLHQSIAADSAQYLVDISRDSSVFTFTPKSQDSIGASVTLGDLVDSEQNNFIYTFKWSDGISFISKAVTINYNFGGGTSNITPSEVTTLGWNSATENSNNAYTLSGTTWTKTGYGGNFDVLRLILDMSSFADADEWNIRFTGGGFGTTFDTRSYHIIHGINNTLDARFNGTNNTNNNWYTQNRSDTGNWEYGGGITKTSLGGSYSSLSTQINYVKATGTWTYYMAKNNGSTWTQAYQHTQFGAGNAIDYLEVVLIKRTGTGLTMYPDQVATIP
jgi:hypothetical protein